MARRPLSARPRQSLRSKTQLACAFLAALALGLARHCFSTAAVATLAPAGVWSFMLHVETDLAWFACTGDQIKVLLRGDDGNSGWHSMDIAGQDFGWGGTGNYRVESLRTISVQEVCFRKEARLWWWHDAWLPRLVEVFDGDMQSLGRREDWGWIDHGRESCWRLEAPPQRPPHAGHAAVFDALFMADIGHAREYRETLTEQFPYGKCRVEGSFSLYEGLQHFGRSQSPDAVFLMGDVVYGGGDARNNAEVRRSFQKYLGGKVRPDMVFPQIGNHDVNLQGCTLDASLGQACYYGSATAAWSGGFVSRESLSFEEWRENWLRAFPGLETKVILPPSAGGYQWQAPLRYNVDPGARSSVYFIAGLLAGAKQTRWGPQQPRGAVPGDDGGGEGSREECTFIRDSVAHGKRLGKTLFVYITHGGSLGGGLGQRFKCDQAVMRELDVWLFGHEHFAAQSPEVLSMLRQEDEEFPAQLLIGNGGFDQGEGSTVGFVQMREYHVGGRARLHFDVYDTCISAETCDSDLARASNWAGKAGMGQCLRTCHHFPDGVAGRKATPSMQHLGFVYEAPARLPARGAVAMLAGKPLRLRAGAAQWLGLRPCNGARCLSLVESQEEAAAFRAYHVETQGALYWARLATDDEHWAPLVHVEGQGILADAGFWHAGGRAAWTLPHHGFRFQLLEGPAGWEAQGLEKHVQLP